MNPTSILIVEDTPTTLEWLESVVTEAFPDARVATATTLASGLRTIRDQAFDLALVDLGLPDGTGLDLIREMRVAMSDDLYIVVATIFDDDVHLVSALREGANGYLLKDEERETMVGQLLGIARDRAPISDRSLARVLDHFRPSVPDVSLTEREEDVLRTVAKGFSVSETAEMLGLSKNTVKSYLKTVYSKLGITSRAEATAEAFKRQLIDV